MIIISHRGYWKEADEKNTSIAFHRSFDLGFGTETDVRDVCGRLVIAHDCPTGDEMDLEDLLMIMDGRNLPLAINIKADGLATRIKDLLNKYQHTNYFCFDMSIPDMVVQLREGLCVYTGQSDILPCPALLDDAEGVWLDSFHSHWWTPELVDELLDRKHVCIVSSDLHKREVDAQWNAIKHITHLHSERLMLCTDHPEEARKYFYEN